MLRSFPQLTPELMAEAIHYYEAHQAEIDAEIHAELRADEHAENCKRRHRTRAGRNSEREEVPLVSLIIPRPCYLRKASSGPRLAALLSAATARQNPLAVSADGAGCYGGTSIKLGGLATYGQSHCYVQNHCPGQRLLHEMQGNARDDERKADHHEEWPTSDRRDLPGVQHQDVQNRRH